MAVEAAVVVRGQGRSGGGGLDLNHIASHEHSGKESFREEAILFSGYHRIIASSEGIS